MFRTLLLLFPLVASSCSGVPEDDVQPEAKNISVTIGSAPELDIESRTALDPDGITVRWVKGDKIALWAIGSDGTPQFQAQDFMLWHYNASYDNAKFTGNISEMPEGTYNYYAVSPKPLSTTGLKAHYEIPAMQNGQFNGACDIMVARPVSGGALTEGDNTDKVNLSFSHKIHVLKITVPTNGLGEEVSGLQITFPQPVAGKMEVDASNPDAAPVITEGSNKITLRFDEPLAVGTTVYAMIAPVNIPEDQVVTITTIGQASVSTPGNLQGKNFAAGRITPITYHISSRGGELTQLRFALPAGKGTATLGEAITKVKLTAPEGVSFSNGASELEFTPDADGKYAIPLKPWEFGLTGKSVAAQYESDNAIISSTLTLPQIVEYGPDNTANIQVPYLLEETFSTVGTYSDGESNNNGDPAAIWIPGIDGWSAARTGGQAGQSVRIVGRREGGMWIFVTYEGRMDSAPLSRLKEGVNVKIKVSFNYSGASSGNAPKLKYGTSTAAGLISGANDGISVQTGSVTANKTGSYTNVTQAITPFTTNATNATRLAWVAYGDNGGFSGGWFYYIYIDNVKVSITQ